MESKLTCLSVLPAMRFESLNATNQQTKEPSQTRQTIRVSKLLALFSTKFFGVATIAE